MKSLKFLDFQDQNVGVFLSIGELLGESLGIITGLSTQSIEFGLLALIGTSELVQFTLQSAVVLSKTV